MSAAPQGSRNLFMYGSKVFIGERLTQAREAQGLTMTGLAQRIGKSKQAISRYESNTDNPSSETIIALADMLQQPIMFFYHPTRPSERQKIAFFRRLRSVKPGDLKRAAVWQHWLEDLALLLEEYVAFPALDLPDYDFPLPSHETLDADTLEQIALALRKHWRLGNGPINHVAHTLEQNGILVARFDLGADDIDAYSFCSDNGRNIVALNNFKTNYFRSRFDACHELAHIIFHQNVDAEALSDSRIYERIERQAHRFSSAFLLPAEPLLKDAVSVNLEDLLFLKEKWGVSVAAITYRLLDLGVISRDEHIRIRRNLARRGWLRGEPLDMATVTEKPVAISQALKALITDAEFSKADVIADIVRAPYVIEQLANLPEGFFSAPDELDLELKHKNLRLTTG